MLVAVLEMLLFSNVVSAEPAYDAHRDQVFVERESGPLALDLYVPRGEGPFPAVIVVHGGAWASGTRAQLSGFAQAMANMGYVAATISYRLAPQHRFPAQVHDCQAAVRWLRSHADDFKIDPEHIGGFGYSAGGHLVALLGAMDDDDFREEGVPEDAPSARLQVVVAGGAPCDFRMLADDSQRLAYWLGGTPGEKPDAYRDASPAKYVSKDDAPMFFYHGTADTVVPIRSPQRMVELLKETGVPVEFFAVPEAGHALAVRHPEAMRLAMEFAARYLKPTAESGDKDVPTRKETEATTADGQ
jgi:acetyl esterase/lipase